LKGGRLDVEKKEKKEGGEFPLFQCRNSSARGRRKEESPFPFRPGRKKGSEEASEGEKRERLSPHPLALSDRRRKNKSSEEEKEKGRKGTTRFLFLIFISKECLGELGREKEKREGRGDPRNGKGKAAVAFAFDL